MVSRRNGTRGGEAAYIVDSPLLLGVRWLRMELSLSVAIFKKYTRRGAADDGTSVEERKKLWKEDVGKSVT